MACNSAPRTELTKRLDPSRRQFFQWFYLEGRTIQGVKEEMDRLSVALKDISGHNFKAGVTKWRIRQRQWNNVWKIRRRDRGAHLAIPNTILHLPLWRRNDQDVGNWRVKRPVQDISPCDLRNVVDFSSSHQQRASSPPTLRSGELGCTSAHENPMAVGDFTQAVPNLPLTSWDSQVFPIDNNSTHIYFNPLGLPMSEGSEGDVYPLQRTWTEPPLLERQLETDVRSMRTDYSLPDHVYNDGNAVNVGPYLENWGYQKAASAAPKSDMITTKSSPLDLSFTWNGPQSMYE